MTARLTPIELEAASEDVRELLERVAPGGEVPNLFLYMARHSTIFKNWYRFTMTLLTRGKLAAVDREILILRTAYCVDSPYEWAQHQRIATEAGLSTSEINAVTLAQPHGLSPRHKFLVAVTDELLLQGDIADDTWSSLVSEFGDEQAMEVVVTVAYYRALADVLRAFRVPLEHEAEDDRSTDQPSAHSKKERR